MPHFQHERDYSLNELLKSEGHKPNQIYIPVIHIYGTDKIDR